ncbi:MAG: amidohydrolase family protein [Sedimentisphaerales bacterium]
MVVDCHSHIRCVGLGQVDISEHLESAEVVDRCIVLGSPDGPTEEVNNQLSQYVAKYEQKMVGFALIDPLNEPVNAKHVRAATEKLGFKGIVLYCAQSGFHPAHTRAFQLYEAAQELHLPVFFHNTPVGPGGILEFARPFLLDEVARTFPSLKIIIGNMGFPFYDQTVCVLAKHENVYADMAVKPTNGWQVYRTVIAAYEQGVMDKLIFGSAFPAARAQACIEALLGFNKPVKEAGLPTVPRNLIQAAIERDTLKLLGIEK